MTPNFPVFCTQRLRKSWRGSSTATRNILYAYLTAGDRPRSLLPRCLNGATRTEQKTPTAENQWCQSRINMASVYSDCNCRRRFESEHKGVQCGSKGKFCGSHHSLAISSLNLRHEIIKSYRGILLEELRKTSVSTADLRAGIWIQKFLNIRMPTIRTLQFSQFRM